MVHTVTPRYVLTARLAFVMVLISMTACATTAPTPKTVTARQLVGAWTEFIGCYGCADAFRVTLLIRDDATWTATVMQGRVPTAR